VCEGEGRKVNATMPELLVVGGLSIVFGLFLGCSVQYISVSDSISLVFVLMEAFLFTVM
jgi:hypothetical protein